jgi:hypothetical protein
MAMRGSPPDGIRPLNSIGGIGPGGVGEEGTLAPAFMAASRVEEPEGLVRGRPAQFIRWRNNCVRTPGIAAEQPVAADNPADFGFTPRFVEKPGEGKEKFVITLWKALASD